jgi:hypothetical protein
VLHSTVTNKGHNEGEVFCSEDKLKSAKKKQHSNPPKTKDNEKIRYYPFKDIETQTN